jgi:hypothetical protein
MQPNQIAHSYKPTSLQMIELNEERRDSNESLLSSFDFELIRAITHFPLHSVQVQEFA